MIQEFRGRELPPDEWGKVEHVFLRRDEPRPLPESTKVLVLENGDEIIATFSSQWLIYLSHLWLKPQMRGNHLAEQLARKTIELYPKGTPAVMVTESGHVEKLAYRIGMIPLRGSAWMWRGDAVSE